MHTSVFSLAGKVALVTGASTGLGKHFALTLARAGADIVIAARRVDLLTEVAKEIEAIGQKAFILPFDVIDCDMISERIPEIWQQVGKIDILINNAGNMVRKSSKDYTPKDWDSIFNTHVRGSWAVSTEITKLMIAHNISGSIINISSAMSYRTRRHSLAYPAAKAAINHFTRSFALELSSHSIRVNAIAPGWFITEMTKDFLNTPEGKKQLEYVPMKRNGELHELDGALLLLASDASSYITGAIIPVDGGCVSCGVD